MEGITVEKVIYANSIYSNTINGLTNVSGSTPGPAGNPAVFNNNTLSIFSNFGVSLTGFGTNWVKSNSEKKMWTSVSLSKSGEHQTAVASDDYIYVSNDSGNTWIVKKTDETGNSLQEKWSSVSLSASGQYQTAVASDFIYVSDDFGNTWREINSAPRNWRSVSLSASGQYQTAVTENGIYTCISSVY